MASRIVRDAALRPFRSSLMRVVATAPARRARLLRRAEPARRLALALDVPAEEIGKVTLAVVREP